MTNRIVLFCIIAMSIFFCACTKQKSISIINYDSGDHVVRINLSEDNLVKDIELGDGCCYKFDKTIPQFERENITYTLQVKDKNDISQTGETYILHFNDNGFVTQAVSSSARIEYKYDGWWLVGIKYHRKNMKPVEYILEGEQPISKIWIVDYNDGIVELIPTYSSYELLTNFDYNLNLDYDLAMTVWDSPMGSLGDVTSVLRMSGLLGARSRLLIKQWTRVIPFNKMETMCTFDYVIDSDYTLNGIVVNDEEKYTICYFENQKKDSIRVRDYDRIHQRQNSIIESERLQFQSKNKMNGYNYVDLGLSVMWADCNIGANALYDYGNYYAWGETYTKESYTPENSKTIDKNIHNISSSYEYDVARRKLGSPWRIPTKNEFEELIEECTWVKGEVLGNSGYIVIGPNGNRIFLPAAGYYSYDTIDSGSGYYWSSSGADDASTVTASFLYFCPYTSSYRVDWTGRWDGYTIRPVF